MNESDSFDGSVPYFCRVNADGTVTFFDSGGRQIPWPGFNAGQPLSQNRQPAPNTGEPHFNQAFASPDRFTSLPMSGSHNAIGPGFLRPFRQRHDFSPPHPPHPPNNIPNPPWNCESSWSSVSASNSSASPRQITPSNTSPHIGNHDADADTNLNTNCTNTPSTLVDNCIRFTCPPCSFACKTQRDFDRHLTTRAHLRKHGHDDKERTVTRFHCAVRHCRHEGGKGFTRMDNLKRHEKKKHQ